MKLKRKTAAAFLALWAIGGAVTVAATQGSQSDPLVTLSYLTDVLTPTILTQVDARTAESRQAYLDKLNASVSGYSTQMEELLGGLSGTGGQNSSVFGLVELAQGQKLVCAAGCELMLRVGTANCFSQASPGLIDSTEGTILDNGKPLTKNHLYIATLAEHGVTAAASVKLLVRGSYTII